MRESGWYPRQSRTRTDQGESGYAMYQSNALATLWMPDLLISKMSNICPEMRQDEGSCSARKVWRIVLADRWVEGIWQR